MELTLSRVGLRVVRECYAFRVEIPIGRMIGDVLTQRRQNCPVVPLGLAVRLRVVRRRKHVRYAQYRAYVLENVGRQLLPVIGQQRSWRPIGERPMGRKRLGNLPRGDASQGYHSSQFGESTRNYL